MMKALMIAVVLLSGTALAAEPADTGVLETHPVLTVADLAAMDFSQDVSSAIDWNVLLMSQSLTAPPIPECIDPQGYCACLARGGYIGPCFLCYCDGEPYFC